MADRGSRSEADFRKRPCGKQQRKDMRSNVKSRIRVEKGGNPKASLFISDKAERPKTYKKTAAMLFAGGFFITSRSPENKTNGHPPK